MTTLDVASPGIAPAPGRIVSPSPARGRSRPRNVAAYELKLALPLAAFFLVFFLAPLAILGLVSLYADAGMTHFGLAQYSKFLLDPFSLGVLASTLWLGAEVTVLCLLLGFPLALVYVRSPRWVQSVMMLVILLPLLTSVVVRTFAWIVILGRQGIVNAALLSLGVTDTPLRLLFSEGGLVVALAQVQMPLMVMPLITALSRIDPNLGDASAALGAGEWRTFRRITLPLAVPGILAGCLLTFAAAITAFITQSLVGGGQMLFMPMYIYQQSTALNNWPFAAAISIIFLVAVLACVTVFNLLGRLSRGVVQA